MICLLLVTSFVSGQSKSDKMYDAFASKDGVTGFTFSKNMIDAINIGLDDDNDSKKVTGNLYKVRFMSYNPAKGNLSGQQFLEKAISYLPAAYRKYEGNEKDEDAEIWLLGGKKEFTECHVFVRNESGSGLQFVVSFYGEFSVTDINKLKASGKEFSEE